MLNVRLDILGPTDDDAPLHSLASELIVGYAPARLAIQGRRERQRALDDLFGTTASPDAQVGVVAVDEDGRLVGGATVEASVAGPLVAEDPERARLLAGAHRTLGAMFVLPDYRGRGIGEALWSEAAYQALRASARYLDGFVDDRNGSVGFYRRVASTVTSHNQGFPARPPAQIEQYHWPELNGHWFTVDLWQKFEGELLLCSRCTTPLRYQAADGGSLTCPTCGPPPASRTDQ